MECLLHLQFITVRTAGIVDPGSLVQACRLDDKRIVVDPFSDGVAVPSGLQNFFGSVSPVSRDIPPDLAVLINDLRLILALPDLYRAQVEEFYAREADGIAYVEGIVVLRNRNGRHSPSRFMRLPCFQPQRRE